MARDVTGRGPAVAAPAPAPAGLRATFSLAVRVLRTRQWAHFALLPFAAVAGGDVAPRALAAGVAAAACALAFAFGLNAIADRHLDAEPAKNPLAGVAMVPPLVSVVVWLAAALALAAAALVGPVAVTATTTSLAAGALYSAGPRWKARPILSTTTNAVIFTPLLAVASAGEPAPVVWLLALTFVTLLTQNQLLHEIADRDEDAAAGVRTTAAWLGTRATAQVCLWLGVAAAGAILARAPGGCAALAALAVVGGGLVRLHGDLASPARARRRHRVFALAAGAALFAAVALAGGTA